MKITFWGTRGSIASPGRDTAIYGWNTTCLEIVLNSGRRVVVDAGTGIRVLGEQLSKGKEKVDIHLLITHIHWDHVLGFPFFKPLYDPSTKIRVDGYPTCMKGLRFTFDNKMGDGFFPVKFSELKAQIRHLDVLSRHPLEIEGASVERVPLQHPQGGFGYRFREGNKTLVFITDNELRTDAGPGTHPEDYARFCRGADILIHDAQYLPDEIEKRRGWGHSDYAAVCRLALEAHVSRLILFHHDPARKDSEVSAIRSHGEDILRRNHSDMTIEAAKEGSELTL
jgi:phosphoribosyl 1,2-cyclic phosphodiesterase